MPISLSQTPTLLKVCWTRPVRFSESPSLNAPTQYQVLRCLLVVATLLQSTGPAGTQRRSMRIVHLHGRFRMKPCRSLRSLKGGGDDIWPDWFL